MPTEDNGTEHQQQEQQVEKAAADQQQDKDTRSKEGGEQDGGKGSQQSNAPEWMAAPEIDQDTRDWLQKSEVKDVPSLAKKSHEQAKLLGNAIRIPGDKATDEEKSAFLNKLGRPEKPADYKFTVPENMPQGLPYDGERAAAFKEKAHAMGLTQTQAAALHDQYIADGIAEFNSSAEAKIEQAKATSKQEADKLVKVWGPLDQPTARANLEFADRFVNEVGGEEAWAELERIGAVMTVGKEKVVASAVLAQMFAKAGVITFQEDKVRRGPVDVLGNPFAEGEGFSLTKAMQVAKSDPDHARNLIAAAGKKPEEFGLKP